MSNKKVLVVENNRVIRNIISSMLKNTGHDVTIVNSAEGALASLHDKKFNIMLTDFCISDMTGLELIETVRKNNKRLKIVMMTAFPLLINREKAIRFKISSILRKPFLMNTLLNSLSNAKVTL